MRNEVGHKTVIEGRHQLILGRDGVDGHGFYYVKDEVCTMVRLHSWIKGGGKAMVAKMKEMLPSGMLVEIDCVVEFNTVEKLIELGYFDQVIATKDSVVVDKADYDKLKVVRVLEGGGLTVERVVVQLVDGLVDVVLSNFDVNVMIRAKC